METTLVEEQTDVLALDDSAPPVPQPEQAAPPVMSEAEAIAAGEQLEQSTVFFEFHAFRPGFVKTLSSSRVIEKMKASEQTGDAEMDSKMLRVSQDIIDRKEVRKISHHDGKFVGWIKSIAIPSPVKFRGAYLLNPKRIEQVEARVEEYLTQRIVLIQAFEQAYPGLKEAAKAKRGEFYNEADYPDWAEIAEGYSVEFNWLSFNVPKALEKINSVIYAKAQAKAKLQWADAVQKAIDLQRATLLNAMDTFVDMLTPSDDTAGKKKKFKPTAVKKLKEFVSMFDELNITNDQQLAQVVKQLEGVLEGVEPATLRKDMELREVMMKKVAQVKEHAATLIQVKERKVVFEDEEDSAGEDTLSLAE